MIKRCREPIYLEWVAREHHVLQALRDSRLPIRRVIDYAALENARWLVMTRLTGRSCWQALQEANANERVTLLGLLGDLHRALQTEPELRLSATDLAAFFDAYGTPPIDWATRKWFEDLYQFF